MGTHISYPQSLLEHMPHDADEFSKSFRAFLTTYFFQKYIFKKTLSRIIPMLRTVYLSLKFSFLFSHLFLSLPISPVMLLVVFVGQFALLKHLLPH